MPPSNPQPAAAPPEPAQAAPRWDRWDWACLAGIVVAVFLAYQPAWGAGFIWDDDAHVTKPALRSLQGLRRIWFDLGATQQYYPFLHSAFWFEHRLFGDAAAGYHLLTIGLHAANAVLVGLLLRRLNFRWAWLAAALFALHPVMVESVAWISEQKNTLSGFFYLTAAAAWLRFDGSRRRRWYALALALFVFGLLSKTVTATLPAALLVVFWWRRGRLSWRRDALPLLPFFALGAVAGLFTAWVERTLIGAQGALFTFSPDARVLIAGRAIFFYLGKLLWPADLIFVYPRWDVVHAAAWQYVFPTAAAIVIFLLWRLRGRTRGPLAGALFFGGTLFPVLGFFNVFPFLFSFVADHFQYLASLGAIITAAGGMEWVGRRAGLPAARALGLAVLALLGLLTWRQSHMYRDAEQLYRTTIARNPASWLAYNNLGAKLAQDGRHAEALGYYESALRLNPDASLLHSNYGMAFFKLGRLPEAVAEYEEALKLLPNNFETHGNLADALYQQGRVAEAVRHYETAMRLKPQDPVVRGNLGVVLLKEGRPQAAAEFLREAVRLDASYARARVNLGAALTELGRPQEAIAELQEAIRLDPKTPDAQCNLGIAYFAVGRTQEAIALLQEAVRTQPGSAAAHHSLGSALSRTGRLAEALPEFQEAVRLDPKDAAARNNLGAAYLDLGRTEEAIPCLEESLKLRPADAGTLNNLGDALLRLGRADEAVPKFAEAARLAPALTEAQQGLAIALCASGRLQEGIARFQDLVRALPGDAGLRANLARALLEAGRASEALPQFQEALRLDPAHEAAREGLELARRSEAR